MSIVTMAQIALGCVIVAAVPWQIYQRRSAFPSKDRYGAWVGGIFVMLAGVALLEAHLRLGYSWRPLPIIGAAVCCAGVGLMLWGLRDYKPKSN